jgi:hypothetical protein
MTGGIPGQYGYNHRARIIGPGEVDGTYYVELPMLAPASRLGPFPSVIPGLTENDRVLIVQIGMTRGDLVIVGKLPGDFPTIDEVPGLSAALAAKANESDLATLTSRVGTDEGLITANGSAIAANTSAIGTNGAAITALQARATTDEGLIAANTSAIGVLASAQRDSYGNDYDISHDVLSTMPRVLATTAITMANGVAYYVKMSTRVAMTLNVIKFCLNAAGVGGTLTLGLWHGPSATALAYAGGVSANGLISGRQDWTGVGATLAAGDLIVVGFLALATTTGPNLACSAPVNGTMLNQDVSVLTVLATSATVSTLPTSALNMGTLTGYTPLGQMPWLAGSP